MYRNYNCSNGQQYYIVATAAVVAAKTVTAEAKATIAVRAVQSSCTTMPYDRTRHKVRVHWCAFYIQNRI